MEFRETLIAAQKNQQQKSSESLYYKARFDPPKKEQKQKDKLSANIQKFLAQKEEEERRKKLEAQRKREELLAMRDPKAIRKIQKTLKVIKSANKSVIADAIDHDNTAVTREGPDQPDQDDYGYESQEAAALYAKMMQKYSKIPDEPKFPSGKINIKKDLNGTRERVKHALQHEDDPVPHKRRRKGEIAEKEVSPPPKYEVEKKRDEKPDKPKVRKPAPLMDFNQLLKLAEQKKKEPLAVAPKTVVTEPEPERLMTKKQKREYEEEMARRQRRQERMEAEKGNARKVPKEDKPVDKDKRQEPGTMARIPKIGDKSKNNNPKSLDKDRISEKEKLERLQREKDRARLEREKAEREKDRLDRERLDKLKAERERIDREMERLNKDRDRLEKKLESSKSVSSKIVDKSLDKSKSKENVKKSIDLKSQNTYRIDKNSNDKKFVAPNKNSDSKHMNSHSSQGKPVPKLNKEPLRNGEKDKIGLTKQKTSFASVSPKINGHIKSESKGESSKKYDSKSLPNDKPQAAPSKPKISNSFDFDKHVSSLGKNGQRPLDKNGVRKPNDPRQFPPGDIKRKLHPDDIRRMKLKRRAVNSDSEYDSEMDDFIDDREEDMDYSRHIKEIFGYDKSKYRDIDDDDDPTMESSFARQQREEYISKKIGIMEDLEDMRMEAMEKKKGKKKRRISDD